MVRRRERRDRWALPARALVAGVLLASVVFASPASAHDPIILTPAQTTPAAGPLLLDGTVSFALYGTVDAPGVTRGFRVRFASGDTFTLSALVPDLPPESSLTSAEFPRISVQSPSGEDIEREPGTVTTFTICLPESNSAMSSASVVSTIAGRSHLRTRTH